MKKYTFTEPVNIGTMEITRGSAILTDPCYERGTAVEYVIDRYVRDGIYDVFVARYCVSEKDLLDTRNAAMLVIHRDSRAFHDKDPLSLFDTAGDIDVESGQCGVFDNFHYPDGCTGEFGNKATFYGECCSATLDTDFNSGIVYGSRKTAVGDGETRHGNGAVTESGYGDGSYPVFKIGSAEIETDAFFISFLVRDEDYKTDAAGDEYYTSTDLMRRLLDKAKRYRILRA
jgi:hypothetical protein